VALTGPDQRIRMRSRGPSRRPTDVVVLVTVLVLAALVRAWPWLQPHTFGGVLEYDDGVYYAAAKALVHGVAPYRDVTILHPPGSALLLAPFAALGSAVGDRDGMAAARVFVVVVALVNTGLVWLLARRLVSTSPVVTGMAALVYAGYPDAVVAEHTVLLEPMVNLFGLLAAVLLLTGRRRTARDVAAGACIAVSVAVKLFGVAYLIAAAVWLIVTGRWRSLLPLAAGFVATLAVVVGPFVALAPHRFWHDVVSTQLHRPPDGGFSVVRRLSDLLGLSGLLHHPAATWLVVAVALTVAVVACLVAAGDRPSWFWWLLATVTLIAFAVSSAYFSHYADTLTPAFALLLARVARGLTRDGAGWTWPLAAVTVVAVVVVFGVATWRPLAHWGSQGDLAAAGRLIPSHACIATDSVSLPIAADRYELPSSRCPGWLDGRGVALTLPEGNHVASYYPDGLRADHQWQAQTLRQLEAAQWVLTRYPPNAVPEWTAPLRGYVSAHFRPVRRWTGSFPWYLWKRS
jgi:hypothetical protein